MRGWGGVPYDPAVTTTPVDTRPRDPDEPDDGGTATGVLDRPVETFAHAADDDAEPDPESPRWRVRGRRVLPGVWFPIVVFAVWRAAHQVVLVVVGGRGGETAWSYDGEHYLRILHYGYWNPRPSMPTHAFFPGLPWLATPLYELTGSDLIAVHGTILLTGLAAFVCVWGVTRAWKDEVVARRAVVLLALFPSSVFLWMFYSEGLFIALGAGAVWADRRNRRWIAAACLVAICTTRSIGVFVPVILVAARLVRMRRIDRWVVVYTLATLIGFGSVLVVMWHQVGDPFAWLHVQDDWGRSVAWPWTSVAQGVDNLYPDPKTIMVPALVARHLDLWSIPIVLLPIFYAAFSRKDRFPMETWMLGVGLIFMGICSSVLASFNRFVLADWVIFPVWASFGGRLPKWVRGLAVVVLGSVSIWTTWRLLDRLAVERFIG